MILIQVLKITILICIFSLIFHFSSAFVNGENFGETIPTELIEVANFSEPLNANKYKFAQEGVPILGNIGVALSTNIGIKFQEKGLSSTINTGLGDIQAVKHVSPNEDITAHMGVIKEYYNLINTDVKKMLDNSGSKTSTLTSYINQLEYRYRTATANMQTLSEQKIALSQQLSESSERITLIKKQIDADFKAFKTSSTNSNIDEYLKAKSEYNYARTHIVFINQYLNQYQYLNNHNKKILDTLINNKDAIVKNAFVVVPDTGIELLKQMDLVVSEAEYKAQNQQ